MIKQTLTAIAISGLMGCATAPKPQQYDVEGFRIFIDTYENNSKDWYFRRGITEGYANDVLGFNGADGIHINWSNTRDKDGNLLPDFETIGHEVWHRVKGNYHR